MSSEHNNKPSMPNSCPIVFQVNILLSELSLFILNSNYLGQMPSAENSLYSECNSFYLIIKETRFTLSKNFLSKISKATNTNKYINVQFLLCYFGLIYCTFNAHLILKNNGTFIKILFVIKYLHQISLNFISLGKKKCVNFIVVK